MRLSWQFSLQKERQTETDGVRIDFGVFFISFRYMYFLPARGASYAGRGSDGGVAVLR
jgi:hypothetical protein